MNYSYSYNNHFKFGYDLKRPFQKRISPDEVFQFEYGKVQERNISWRQANILAAKKIRENFDGPLCILFSGGTDSEVCVKAFIEAKIPFTLATLRFDNNLNSHDIEYVKKFTDMHGLETCYFNLNILDFWNSQEMLRIADSVSCVSPILACHLWLAAQVSGVPIIGQGEPHLQKKVPENYVPGVSPYQPSEWSIFESERLCSLYQYFIQSDKPAVPGFFQYVPEQIYSFCFDNPILIELVENRVVGKLGTRSSKNKMIEQFYPEIIPRPKYTGSEKIEAEHSKWRKFLADRFPDNDANASLEYSLLRKMLSANSEDS